MTTGGTVPLPDRVSSAGPPRFCYLVLSHADVPSVLRLVRTLRRGSPAARIVVSHDPTSSPIGAADVAAAGAELQISGPRVRSSYGMVEQLFSTIEWLDAARQPYDWLIVLSGQDYPTQPLRSSEAFLAASDADAFLECWDIADPAAPYRRHQSRLRYLYRYRRLPDSTLPWLRALRAVNGVQRWLHVQLTYGPQLGVRVRRPPFDDRFRCYRGLLWMTLRRACAEHAVAAARAAPALIEHFRHTISPEEAVVQTLLANAGRFRLVNDSLRYMDFAGSRDGRPRVLTVADLPEITRSRYHFARKFDPRVDAAVLDRLDERL